MLLSLLQGIQVKILWCFYVRMQKSLPCIVVLFLVNAYCERLSAQSNKIVVGTVQDEAARPAAFAHIYATKGTHTVADSLGTFYLPVMSYNDSVYVMYKGHTSSMVAIPANHIVNVVISTGKHEAFGKEEVLKDVIVYNKNHQLDSLARRSEYSKVFNAPSSGQYLLRYLTNPLQLHNLFYGLRFKENKKKQFYKGFAISLEQDKYVKSRFTKALVLKYTGLTGDKRDAFMAQYAPTYEQALMLDDIHMAQFIMDAYKDYQRKHEQ